jgi:hypothetical protein
MFEIIKKWITSEAAIFHYVIFSIVMFVAIAMLEYYPLAGGAGILSLAFMMFRHVLKKEK